jgi:exopolysaccharide biosynthesis protein
VTVAALLAAVAFATSWEPVAPGVWVRQVTMAESGPLAVVRVIAVRVDPARVSFALDTATIDGGSRGAWSVKRTPPRAFVAVNTGQFNGGGAWGWLVHNGDELNAPGKGALAMAFVVDSTGTTFLLTPLEVSTLRGRARLAIQSYPMLLTGVAEIPWELQAPGRGVDLDHRDSRLALGMMRDGSVVFALTRFSALGIPGAETLPWGPTVVEMAAFMRTLGCQRAMLLDGGISSQMAVRNPDGTLNQWTNWRKVPVGLIVSPP